MKIIAFEGIDACGKTTAINNIIPVLEQCGYKVGLSKEPDYTSPMGKLILSALVGDIDISQESLHLLYELDRLERNEAYYEGLGVDILIQDRCFLSNDVYGKANGLPVRLLQQVRSLNKHYRAPDTIIYLDITAEESFRRKSDRDLLESNLDFLNKVREAYVDEINYIKSTNHLGMKAVILDGTAPKAALSGAILYAITSLS